MEKAYRCLYAVWRQGGWESLVCSASSLTNNIVANLIYSTSNYLTSNDFKNNWNLTSQNLIITRLVFKKKRLSKTKVKMIKWKNIRLNNQLLLCRKRKYYFINKVQDICFMVICDDSVKMCAYCCYLIN